MPPHPANPHLDTRDVGHPIVGSRSDVGHPPLMCGGPGDGWATRRMQGSWLLHDRGELARLLLYDDGADDAVAIGHDVVAVDVAPLVAFAWFGEVMGAVVIDAFAAVPIVVFHVVAALPLLMADVLLLLVVVVVIVTILCGGHDRSGADAEKDERGYCFFEQGFFLQRCWTSGG